MSGLSSGWMSGDSWPMNFSSARSFADAWVSQLEGHENYFFNNVKHGIRTPDDLAIWRRIEDRSPRWINAEPYKEAIEILRGDAELLCKQRSSGLGANDQDANSKHAIRSGPEQ